MVWKILPKRVSKIIYVDTAGASARKIQIRTGGHSSLPRKVSKDVKVKGLQDIFTDGVCSGELLPEHDHKSNRESLAVARSQAFPPSYTLSCIQLFLDGGSDLSHLLDDFWAVHRLASDMRQ